MRFPKLAARCFVLAALGCTAGAALAQTSAPSAAQLDQRQRMTACNAEAGTQHLTGDPRKTFMSDCLSGKVAAAAPPASPPANTQQEKMKTCNATASSQKLAGDARKQFMSTCLKG